MEDVRSESAEAARLRRKYYKCGGCEKLFDRATHAHEPHVAPNFANTYSTCPDCFAKEVTGPATPRMNSWAEATLTKVFGLAPEKAREIVAKYTR
ncbi:MAG: hypothetical protein AB1626_04495 [Candidatus Micrarchaeota archaeon]